MIRADQIRLSVFDIENEKEAVMSACAKKLGIKESDISGLKILRRSIDARKKPDEVYYVYSVSLEHKGRLKYHGKDVTDHVPVVYKMPGEISVSDDNRPVVVGLGPAGLFAGLILARCNLRPIILERGRSIDDRQRDVEAFFETGRLDTKSNVLFGEGGAGTFSDGKLNSQVKDREGRIDFILETFTKYGAPSDILYEQKPHVGTDILSGVVKSIRTEIEALGGEVRFDTQLTDILTEGKSVIGLRLSGGEKIECKRVILAIGHSARDTFRSLYDSGIDMQAKEFAVGLRVEHPQEMIDIRQYGKRAAAVLPAAPYKLTHRSTSGRGVYSFCMCPGGFVVNASSEEGMLAVNGMSYSGRDSGNANSAIIVSVGSGEYDLGDPLSGIEFQRKLEKRAFDLCSGAVPQQLYGDFLKKRASVSYGDITPRLKGRGEPADLSGIFPEDIYEAFCEGMSAFDKKIPGFAREDAVLSGVESRTSSPVRIPRNENFMSSCRGLFPCGEGAGYAGGILSAAIDGMKVAEAVIRDYGD